MCSPGVNATTSRSPSSTACWPSRRRCPACAWSAPRCSRGPAVSSPREAEFRALLVADPNDARAARGLARVLSWSGRFGEADRSYERALALAPDKEAASEWGALRAGFPPTVATRYEWYDDNDNYRRMGSSLEGSYYWDPDTHLRSTLSYTAFAEVRRPDAGRGAAARAGGRAGLALERTDRRAHRAHRSAAQPRRSQQPRRDAGRPACWLRVYLNTETDDVEIERTTLQQAPAEPSFDWAENRLDLRLPELAAGASQSYTLDIVPLAASAPAEASARN